VPADLAISIVGDDLELMRTKADSIADIVRNMKGAVAVNVEQKENKLNSQSISIAKMQQGLESM